MILGLGAQKAGSSWLFSRLAAAPEIAAPALKEWHFFDCWLRPDLTADVSRIMAQNEARIRARNPDGPRARAHAARRAALQRPAAYLEHFAAASAKPFMIDVSPEYALLDADDLENVAAYFRAAGVRLRPVFVMRDPVERLFSYARALGAARGKDPARIFRAALKDPVVMARSRYETTLSALWSAFPREEVAIGFYEHLTTDESALAALATQIGLAPPPAAPERRVNASPEAALPQRDAAEARARLAPTYAFIKERLGAETPASWGLSRS
ncbi:hypothetical protein G5B40_03595 [Pikeienuella piscinae]|uniref:Sulfotransferase family protein n=2 Tax=Pikeienuella piscinae TaxID=2748098 RepID=A0A7L5BTX7_9RHOB|nr:hypothetical protein G5B40_03595 [Pikeienuella piscinae]